MPLSSSHLVIFDCDGVLVDSERLAVDIDVQAVTAAGWSITRDEVIDLFVGRSELDMRRAIEAHLGHPLAADWDADWTESYSRVFDEQLEAVPGVEAALAELADRRVPTCVASSGTPERIERSLTRTGLWSRFAGRVFSATEVDNGKPAPDLFLHAAQATGFPPRQCVVVEDSRYGVTAARAARMKVIGYAGGITPPTHLVEADAVISDMAELVATIDRVMS